MTPREQAKAGLWLLKEAVEAYVRQHPDGVTHSEVVSDLDLYSDFEGSQRNYLSWSVLGLLIRERRVRYEGGGRSRLYFSMLGGGNE